MHSCSRYSCSGKDINLNDLTALLPSRCDVSKSFCEKTCHAIGRRTGTCTIKVDLETASLYQTLFTSGLLLFRMEMMIASVLMKH